MNTVLQLLLMGGRFDPTRHFFGQTDPGDWWDPSDLPLMYQDSAGTVPAAVGSPVGLIQGQRFKGQRGAEAVVNGDASNGKTGWTDGAGITAAASGGAFHLARNGAVTTGAAFRQTINVTAGVRQELTLTVANANAAVRVDSATQVLTATALATGSRRITFVPDGSTATINFWPENDLTTAQISGISCKAVPGIHRYQTTSANRPTLKQDANGKYYLSYNGTNSWMQTSAVDFSGTDKVTICGAWTKLSDAARGIILELGAASPSFRVDAPTSPGAAQFGFASSGTGGSAFVGPIGYPAPFAAVLTCQGDIASDGCSIRVNGALGSSVAPDQGTGNYRNDVLYWGARTGTSLFFNGNEYISAIAGAAKSESLIARMERFAAQRAGIVL